MAKKKYSLNEIKSGTTFTDKVYLPNGSFLLLPATPVTEREIAMIESWGFNEIESEGNPISPVTLPPVEPTKDPEKTPTREEHVSDKNDKTRDIIALIDGIDNISQEASEEETKGQSRTDAEPVLISSAESFNALHNDCVHQLESIFFEVRASVPPPMHPVREMSIALLDILKSKLNIPLALVRMEPADDKYLSVYSVNVALLSLMTGAHLGLDHETLIQIGIGALLHDIGMQRVPQHILNKKSALSDADFNIIKKHPLNGYEMLAKNNEFSEIVTRIVLEHHEERNGNGYPKGLQSVEISLPAKIVALTVMYEAMTRKRLWRPETPSYNVMKMLLQDSGKRFEPDVVSAFVDILSIYPVGTLVNLNTKEIALVVEANTKSRIRPKLRILITPDGKQLNPIQDIDLAQERTRFITGTIDKNSLPIKDIDIYLD